MISDVRTQSKIVEGTTAMAANLENGLTYTMSFSCIHRGEFKTPTLEGVKADKWFKVCGECGVRVNWSPKLKAWMSEKDWEEYRNFGRRAAGLDSDNELYEQHRKGCDACWMVDNFKGGKRCEEGQVLVRAANKELEP